MHWWASCCGARPIDTSAARQLPVSAPSRPAFGCGWLVAIAGLALVVRLAAIAYSGDFQPPFEQEWESIARTIVQHGFFGMELNNDYGSNTLKVTSFIPPLYPLLLAGLAKLFGGQGWLAIRLLQAVLSTLSVLLGCDLAWLLWRQVPVTRLAGLMAAVFPPLVASVAESNPVTIEVLLLLLFIRLSLPARLVPGAPAWRWVAAGAVLGLAALNRAPILSLLPWIVVVLWVNRLTGVSLWSAVVGPVLVVGALAAIVISPWAVRNYVALHAFVPISTNGGINFWIGNNPRATGEYISPPEVAPGLLRASDALGEPQRDIFFYTQGILFIREDPRQFVRLLGLKLYYFIWERPDVGKTYGDHPGVGLGRLAYLLGTVALLPLWVLGALLTARDWRRLLVVHGPILVTLAQNLAYFVATRFRTPAAPFQILLAAYALALAIEAGTPWLRRECALWVS